MTTTFIWKQIFANYQQIHYPLLPEQITSYYSNLSGNQCQVRLNNQFNEEPLVIDRLLISRQANLADAQPLTLNGQQQFQLPAGQSAWTDPLEYTIIAGETYYLGLKAINNSGTINSLGYSPAQLLNRLISAPPRPDLSDYYYGIDALRCQSTTPAILISFFGDSIISQGYLTETLSQLLYQHWPQLMTTSNAGIFGNRLLHSGQIMSEKFTSVSQAGVQRFSTDVIYDGPQVVIVLMGSNDLITAGAGSPRSELPSSQHLINGIQRLARICQWRKITFVPLTLPPFKGATNLGLPTWQPAKEKIRLLTNQFIQHLPYAIDLASYVMASQDSATLAPEFDAGDHWHLSALGAQKISQFIYRELRNTEAI